MRRRSLFRLVALGVGLACANSGLAAVPSPTRHHDALAVSAREHRLADHLASGGLPRDQAMHAVLTQFHAALGDARALVPGELREAASEAPRDRLVQWLWATADETLADCTPARPCPERSMALAVLEPENAAAWLPALSEASRRGDADRVDAILGRMAEASTFDQMFIDSAEAWYAAEVLVPLSPSEAAEWRKGGLNNVSREGMAIYAAIARAAAFSIPSLQPLSNACRADRDPRATARRVDCERLGRTLLGSTTMLPRSLGFGLLQRIGAATPADAQATRRSRWLASESNRVAPSMETDPNALRRYFSDLLATRDEYEAMSRRIVRGGGRVEPPSDWKRGEPALR